MKALSRSVVEVVGDLIALGLGDVAHAEALWRAAFFVRALVAAGRSTLTLALPAQMEPEFRKPNIDELESVSNLIRTAFDRHVGTDWSEQACSTFHDEVSPKNLLNAFAEAFFGEVCAVGDAIAGVVLLPNARVIALTFVASEHARRGMATTLIAHGVREVEEREPEVSTIFLNSTRHAMPFYESQGFFPISPEFSYCGTVATHMALWLPYYHSLHNGGGSANPAFNRTRRSAQFVFGERRRRRGG